jgi:hypothetical protein
MLPGEQVPVLIVVARRTDAGAPPIDRARFLDVEAKPIDLASSPSEYAARPLRILVLSTPFVEDTLAVAGRFDPRKWDHWGANPEPKSD